MNTPFFYIEVWRGGDQRVIGTVVDLDTYKKDLALKARLHSFTGRTATVCVLDFDQTISREMKLDFAIMFMKGRYVTITVDLANLTSTSEAGNPPPCY